MYATMDIRTIRKAVTSQYSQSGTMDGLPERFLRDGFLTGFFPFFLGAGLSKKRDFRPFFSGTEAPLLLLLPLPAAIMNGF